MKKKIRMLVAIGLVSIMSITALAGCSKANSVKNDAKNTEVTKPEKISWYCNVGPSQGQGIEQWKEQFKKNTGITLEYTPQNNNDYNQNLELAFSSKNAPDVFCLAGGDKLPLYASQGALADLTDLVKASGLITDRNKAAWDSVTINGKIYGVPWEINGGTVTYVRQDWLDKLGMKAPTNYNEFIEMLRAFKSKIPECKIPFTAAKLVEGQAVMYLREFYQDATPEFTEVDGKWVDGMTQDNMKPALQRMQDAYKEGLIDTEVVTNTTSACRDKWGSGNTGVFNYWSGQWNVYLEDNLKPNAPNSKVTAIAPIKETKYLMKVPTVTSISSTCKNIPGVFKYFIEYMNDGGEGSQLFEYGVEGLHWKQEGDHIITLPKLDNPKEKMNKAFITQSAALMPLKDKTKIEKEDDRIISSNALLAKNGVQLKAQPVSKKLGKINAELEKLKAKIVSTVVMGKVSVDEGINTYINESKNLGIDEVVKEMNGGK